MSQNKETRHFVRALAEDHVPIAMKIWKKHRPVLEVNAVDKQYFRTPLHWACVEPDATFLSMLLADPEVQREVYDVDYQSPVNLARAHGYELHLRLLREDWRRNGRPYRVQSNIDDRSFLNWWYHDIPSHSLHVSVPMNWECVLSQISSRLYLSGSDAAMYHSILRYKKITHVISIASNPTDRIPQEGYLPDPDRFTYLQLDFPDNKYSKLPFGEAVNFFLDMVTENEDSVMLVHCRMGVSRSVSLVLAILMIRANFSLQEAIGYVQARRPVINPNSEFMAQLGALERSEVLKDLRTKWGVDKTDMAVFQKW